MAAALEIMQVNGLTHGDFYLVKDDMITFLMMYHGTFAPLEIDFITSILKPGDNVLEIGTNVGCHTVPIAKRVGESGSVLCFEPQRRIFQILNSNIVLNRLSNVVAYNFGIGAEDVDCTIFDAGTHKSPAGGLNTGSQTLIGMPPASDALSRGRIRTPAHFPELLTLDRLNLIKIDVEGMEVDVLRSIAPVIERYGPDIFVEFNAKTGVDVYLLLRAFGYRVYQFITANSQYKNKILNMNLNGRGDLNLFATRRADFENKFELREIDTMIDIDHYVGPVAR